MELIYIIIAILFLIGAHITYHIGAIKKSILMTGLGIFVLCLSLSYKHLVGYDTYIKTHFDNSVNICRFDVQRSYRFGSLYSDKVILSYYNLDKDKCNVHDLLESDFFKNVENEFDGGEILPESPEVKMNKKS